MHDSKIFVPQTKFYVSLLVLTGDDEGRSKIAKSKMFNEDCFIPVVL